MSVSNKLSSAHDSATSLPVKHLNRSAAASFVADLTSRVAVGVRSVCSFTRCAQATHFHPLIPLAPSTVFPHRGLPRIVFPSMLPPQRPKHPGARTMEFHWPRARAYVGAHEQLRSVTVAFCCDCGRGCYCCWWRRTVGPWTPAPQHYQDNETLARNTMLHHHATSVDHMSRFTSLSPEARSTCHTDLKEVFDQRLRCKLANATSP